MCFYVLYDSDLCSVEIFPTTLITGEIVNSLQGFNHPLVTSASYDVLFALVAFTVKWDKSNNSRFNLLIG